LYKNSNDSVDGQSSHRRAMKGKAKGSKLKGTSAYFWERSKEVIWLQIGSARTQRYVGDVTSDLELTPDRTPMIGSNHSSTLRVDARTTQSGAVMADYLS
jgi:hypothetical protein